MNETTDMSNESLMSVTEAAGFLGVHPNTVRSLITRRELVGFKIGQQLRLFRSDVHQWFTDNQRCKLARRQEGQGNLALSPLTGKSPVDYEPALPRPPIIKGEA